ncbi:MAG: cytochrome c oxidase subunit 3 family protein [Xanthomonadales bacterium]|nr:cytochrome c oxidase subunit 3 family protein [Xanthomonadales bacterium]
MNARAARLRQQFDDPPQQREAATLGMWIFIATEVLFFGILFAGYVLSRVAQPDAFAAASRHTDFLLGTIETGVLLASSCLAALAVREVQLGGRRVAVWLLAGTAALGISFLLLHGYEYYSEWQEGLVPGFHWNQTGPHERGMQIFFFLYYAITGFHSLHVGVGIGLVSIMAWRTAHGDFDADYHTPLEISVLYWHLVDLVWIFVYPLLYLIGRAP